MLSGGNEFLRETKITHSILNLLGKDNDLDE